MRPRYRLRRAVFGVILLVVAVIFVVTNPEYRSFVPSEYDNNTETTTNQTAQDSPALSVLAELEIKGRAPKTGYSRDQFGGGWSSSAGCDVRNMILYRDLEAVELNDKCQVTQGILKDPYTGKIISFTRGPDTSGLVQIDHVVALSDAWQKGAQLLDASRRKELANDPLELLAVDGEANQQKSDGDAATWLPSLKPFRCQYVARQIAVKQKYHLWITSAEHEAMQRVLSRCPGQLLPIAKPVARPV